MGRLRVQQTSLITGVVAPTLLGRTDLEKYYSGVAEAENVVISPHGGMERRSGLRAIEEVNDDSRLFSFEFSATQSYIMVFASSNKLKIFLPDGTNVYDVTISGISWSSLEDIDIIQSADTVIMTQEDMRPIQIQRQGSDSSWSISYITLLNIPKYDYDSDKVPSHFNYGDSQTQTIQINGIVYNNDLNDTNGFDEFLYKAKTLRTSIDLSTEDYSNATNWEDLGIRPNVWGYSYDYYNSGASDTETVQIGELVFNNDGNDVKGLDEHLYRAKTLRTAIDLANEDYSNATNWTDLGEHTSTDRGWLRTCTFHQGRLCFGGSKSKPTSVWCSVVNDFYNFDIGGTDVQADDAIFDVLDADQYNAINNIVSSRTLQALTAGGEFTNNADILTPSTSAWTRDTGYGASRIKPVVLDGATYFMDRFRKTVRGFIYDWNEGGYTTPPISILAEHIINDVQDLDIVRGSSVSVANLLYLINGDGTVAVFNTMRKENIAGWTKWTTNGEFKRVTVTGDVVSFIVERDGTEYLEILDDSVLLDHTFSDTTTDRVTVDALLQGEEIRIVADGVTQTGTTATGTEAIADHTADIVYAGLNYDVLIKTLPISANTEAGNFVHQPRRITKAIVNLYESRGVYVNGNLVTSRKFGTDNLDVALEPVTGIESVYLLGYDTSASIEITQSNPEPLQILALDLEVSY